MIRPVKHVSSTKRLKRSRDIRSIRIFYIPVNNTTTAQLPPTSNKFSDCNVSIIAIIVWNEDPATAAMATELKGICTVMQLSKFSDFEGQDLLAFQDLAARLDQSSRSVSRIPLTMRPHLLRVSLRTFSTPRFEPFLKHELKRQKLQFSASLLEMALPSRLVGPTSSSKPQYAMVRSSLL